MSGNGFPRIDAVEPSQRPAGGRSAEPEALLVSPYRSDRIVLERIFGQQAWRLFAVKTIGSALSFLERRHVPLVFTESELPMADWKDLLLEIQECGHSPLLVVISRFADDYLWSEVLNRGGHDVLAKPLSESEVLWVATHAFSRGSSAQALGAASHQSLSSGVRFPRD